MQISRSAPILWYYLPVSMERLVPLTRFYPDTPSGIGGAPLSAAERLVNLPLILRQTQRAEIRKALLSLNTFPGADEYERVSERFAPVTGVSTFLLDEGQAKEVPLFSFSVTVRDVELSLAPVPVPMYYAVITYFDTDPNAACPTRAGDCYLKTEERESIKRVIEELRSEGIHLLLSMVNRDFLLLTRQWAVTKTNLPIAVINERVQRELQCLPRRVYVQDITPRRPKFRTVPPIGRVSER